ncbi:MAG: alpha/beta hydrolase [Acidobacteria bacterium]|nr:alpha/beta hydrolase [Acidobacteriota bacterium]
MNRVMWLLILIPLFVYLGLGLLAWLLADRLIFQPQPALYRDDRSVIKIATPSGEKISAKFFPAPDAEYTILFSHGNAEDIGGAGPFFEELRRQGFNVLAYDYRGYGTSDGAPSEKNAYEDAAAAYDYLVDQLKIPPAKIIVFGRSLGGAVAIDLAARKPCAGLIAESTFLSAFRVLTRYRVFPFDEFDNLGKLPSVNCPALFIHGKKDEVIPFRHGEKLFEAARAPKYSRWFDEAGHNDVALTGGKDYFQTIRDFVAQLPR